MAETPTRKIRIDDDTWERITHQADRYGETASTLIRRAILRYLEEQS